MCSSNYFDKSDLTVKISGITFVVFFPVLAIADVIQVPAGGEDDVIAFLSDRLNVLLPCFER